MPARRAALTGLAALAVLTSACTRSNAVAQDRGNGDRRYIAGAGTLRTVAAADRKAAPSVRGRLLDGAAFSLSSLRGTVVVLNFWGSWCGPCRAELPGLQGLATELRPRGVHVVGVNVRDSRAAAQAFLRTSAVAFPSLFDPAGRVALDFRGTLPPEAIPTTLVIDRSGRIAARGLGPLRFTQLAPVVLRVAAERPA